MCIRDSIIAIADVYDAMTAARSYRAPLCPFEVIAEFEKDGLQKYKPKYILTFLENIANAYQNNRVMSVSYTHLSLPAICLQAFLQYDRWNPYDSVHKCTQFSCYLFFLSSTDTAINFPD